MFIFVRFIDIENKIFRNKLLAIVTIKDKTLEDLFKNFDDLMTYSDISYHRIVSICTDGTPAMMGKEKGLVNIIRNKNAQTLFYQYIIYQTSLCGKLSATLKDIMDSLVTLINFIKSRFYLQQR